MKTYKILCISFIALVCASCHENLLEPLPKDRLATELFWQTEQDAIYASNGVYSVMGHHWRYIAMDAYADIAHFILQYLGESAVEKHTFDAANSVMATEWRYYYNIVQASSSFLENIDRVEKIDEKLKARLIAEAKTLRAFAYINLAMLYGDVPLVTTSLTVAEAKSISRTPVSDIWNFISEELTAAATDLPPIQSDRGRVTKGTALGLKARAMLYVGRNQEAKAAAKSVMDLGVHKLHDSYAELFDYAGEEASEIMFARQYAKNLVTHHIFYDLAPNSIYYSTYIAPTKPLVDAYLMKTTGLPVDDPASGFDPRNPYKDRDPRLYHTVYIPGDLLPNGQTFNSLPGSGTGDDILSSAENVSKLGWYYKKWISNEDYPVSNRCGVNLIYLRYAEVLLTYAEACIELGEIDQTVLDALNAIRNRSDVNMPNVTTLSQTELRKIVRRERMVELAMEGLRLYDIRRWRIGEEVIPGTLKGMTYVNPNNPEELVTAELIGYVKEFKPDRHYLWPIPLAEQVLNSNLTQNPGY